MNNMKKTLRKLSSPSRVVSVISLIFTFFGLYAIIQFVSTRIEIININEISGLLIAIGLISILIIIIQSLSQQIYSTCWPEKRILCDIGVSGSLYSFENLLDDNCKKIVLVGQNIRTVLSDSKFKERIIKLIKKNDKLEVLFIGTTYEGMKAISPECAEHFDETLRDLKYIYESIGDECSSQLKVCFHPSATSLSVLFRDPDPISDNVDRAILVMTPKWARDADPQNRLYCVIERWEYPNLFKRIYGHISAMTQSDSQSLSEICRVIKNEINTGQKKDKNKIKPILDEFIGRKV